MCKVQVYLLGTAQGVHCLGDSLFSRLVAVFPSKATVNLYLGAYWPRVTAAAQRVCVDDSIGFKLASGSVWIHGSPNGTSLPCTKLHPHNNLSEKMRLSFDVAAGFACAVLRICYRRHDGFSTLVDMLRQQAIRAPSICSEESCVLKNLWCSQCPLRVICFRVLQTYLPPPPPPPSQQTLCSFRHLRSEGGMGDVPTTQ